MERLGGGDPEPLSLTHGEIADAAMTAEHSALLVDDVAGLAGFGAQPLDQLRIGALRDKADVLAVGLVGDRQTEMPGQRTGLVLGQPAQRKTQEIEFGARRRKQEIALVSGGVSGAMQLRSVGSGQPARIVSGG